VTIAVQIEIVPAQLHKHFCCPEMFHSTSGGTKNNLLIQWQQLSMCENELHKNLQDTAIYITDARFQNPIGH